jgi:hypothetical protein
MSYQVLSAESFNNKAAIVTYVGAFDLSRIQKAATTRSGTTGFFAVQRTGPLYY